MVGKCADDKIPGMLCICSDDIGSVRMYTNAIAREGGAELRAQRAHDQQQRRPSPPPPPPLLCC